VSVTIQTHKGEQDYVLQRSEKFSSFHFFCIIEQINKLSTDGGVVMWSEDGADAQASWGPTRRRMLLTTLSLLIGPKFLGATATEDHHMKQHEQRVEKPNPNAPAELSRFAFLIGRWKFDAA